MREPISDKLEQDTSRLEQANARLTTTRRDLRKVEGELKSGQKWIIVSIVGMMVLTIICLIILISTGSVGVGIIFFIGVFFWLIFTDFDQKPANQKLILLNQNIGNINSEIETIESSIGNINAAMKAEENLDYQRAIDLFDQVGLSSEAKRIRTKMQKEGKVKVDQTVVHGDYVDDRDTIIKDSVISKSNVGAGGKSKAEDLREAKSLFEEGLIDESEYKQMKKEILGK